MNGILFPLAGTIAFGWLGQIKGTSHESVTKLLLAQGVLGFLLFGMGALSAYLGVAFAWLILVGTVFGKVGVLG